MTKLQKFFYPNGAVRTLRDNPQGASESQGTILHFIKYNKGRVPGSPSLVVLGSNGRTEWYFSASREGRTWEWVVRP